MSAKYILSLNNHSSTLDLVGGKGVSLSRMVSAGLPVPDGFHITTSAYRRFVDENGLLPRVLKALEDEDKTLSEFISEVPQYPTLRENVACKDEVKHKVVEEVEDELRSVFPRFNHVSTVDGVRLALEDGWILIRASGTEPVLRLTVEGESLKKARQIMEKGMMRVKKLIGAVGK